MNSSPHREPSPAPLVADGGVPFRASQSDGFVGWLDLMETLEALCPQWPAARPMLGDDYRL